MVVKYHLMYLIIYRSSLLLVEFPAPRFEQRIHFLVFVPDKIEFSRPLLGGMPDIVAIRVAREATSHDHGVEFTLIYKFREERRPLYYPYFDVNFYLL